jgi:hypothetical protein
MNIYITHIDIFTWNSRGISNKLHELQLFLNTQKIDILFAIKTTLAPHINFFMPGYTIIESNHPSNRRRGGAAIFIETNIRHDILPGIIENEDQVALISLLLHNRTYRIGPLYSAPRNIVT